MIIFEIWFQLLNPLNLFFNFLFSSFNFNHQIIKYFILILHKPRFQVKPANFVHPPGHSKKDLHWNMCVLLELINISIEDSSKLRIVVSRFETSLVKFSTNPWSRSNCFLIVPPRWNYLTAKNVHENRIIRDGQFLCSNHVDNI